MNSLYWFGMSLPAVSRHLRVLGQARLIRRRRDGRLHLIAGRAAAIKEAQDWITNYVAGWQSSFDALDKLLIDEQRKEKKR